MLILRFLFSVFAWISCALLTVFYCSSVYVTAPVLLPLGKTPAFARLASRAWAKSQLLVFSLIWRFRVEGRSGVPQLKNYIVVANHQSLVDILAVLAAVPFSFKFMAKRSLFNVPFLGWHMGFAGYIPIDRGSARGRGTALDKARTELEKGHSLLLFPEGTRSPDGVMLPFKPGAFKLAQDYQIPILPVVIDGTRAVIPKNSKLMNFGVRINVSIGQPVKISKDKPLAESIEAIRSGMQARLEKIRAQK